MSNIEPTDITRTMRCPTCNAVGTHVIDASMRNESVLCPACAESGKRSTCVAVIEPTEEQMSAAVDCYAQLPDGGPDGAYIQVIARLLAEREAKLREERDAARAELAELWRQETEERDTLRARVAELEAERDRLIEESYDETYALRSALAREAQHLADIKALMAKRLVDMREAARWGAEISANVDDATDHQIASDIMEEFAALDAEDELMQRLAHYDDAKAEKCTHSARTWNVIDQTMRCKVCDDAKADAPAVPSFSQWRETPIARNLLKQLKTIAPASTEGEATDE